MININNAINLFKQQKYPHLIKKRKYTNCISSTLAKTIFAPIDLPNFNNSAVDGFSLFSKKNRQSIKILGNLAAGSKYNKKISKYTCLRVMTGAYLPKSCKFILLQEQTQLINGTISFFSINNLKSNIRFKGEDVEKGQSILKSNTLLKSGHISLLMALGIEYCYIYASPTVSIISTGSELLKPGENEKIGKVFYCSGFIIKTILKKLGVSKININHINDNLENTKKIIQKKLNYDLLILLGGISTGVYDYVKRAFTLLKIKTLFYKGEWRPGKPMFFGKYKNCLILGLPGNPAAAFILAQIFIPIYLQNRYKNKKSIFEIGFISNNFIKNNKVSLFIRAVIDEQHRITFFKGQGSHQISTIAYSNIICILPKSSDLYYQGSPIKYIYMY